MRYLAIARFRLLTTIRAANTLFAVAAIAAIGPAALNSFMPDEVFRAGADDFLGVAATTAVIAWIAHALILGFACDSFGKVTLLRTQITSVETEGPADLMDTSPIRPSARFWGEVAGILAAAMTIHVCTLPVLVLVAALSPLPTAMFIAAEAATIMFVVLAATAGAWKRRARPTKWSGTRSARSGLLFFILLALTVRYTTRWEAFRDSLPLFIAQPSPRVWSAASNAVDNPLLLFTLLSLLYTGYIAFFYASSVRTARR